MTAQFNFIFLVYEKVKENGKGEDAKFTVYIACLHFITTTITTVGYGENNITNALPQIITIALMFSGIVFYGYLFRQMMNVLKLMSTFKETLANREEDRDAWILNREKGNDSGKTFFSKKSEKIFNFAQDYDIPGIFAHEFYELLPPNYKEQSYEGPLDLIKSTFYFFFKLIDYQKTNQLFHFMIPKQYLKGAVIIEKQQPSPGLWFIVSGSVIATHSDSNQIELVEYGKGSYFGDVCLINEVSDRFMVAGEDDLQCLFLSYQNFIDIMLKETESMKRLRSMYLFRAASIKVEETKFLDIIRDVVENILNDSALKEENETNKRKVTRKFEKQFSEMVDAAIVKTIKNIDDQTLDTEVEITKKMSNYIKAYFSDMLQKRSYESLTELRDVTLKKDTANLPPVSKTNTKKLGKENQPKSFDEVLKPSDLNIDYESNNGANRMPLKEPEPEIFNPNKDDISLQEKEARLMIQNYPVDDRGYIPIMLPKSKKKPTIDKDLMMDEGSHQGPNSKLTSLQQSALKNFKPWKEDQENDHLMNKLQKTANKMGQYGNYNEENRQNLNKLSEFIDLNVPAMMGEVVQNRNGFGDVLNTMMSSRNPKTLPDTLETEGKKSKYDENFEFFVHQLVNKIEPLKIDPNLEEYEFSSDEDVSVKFNYLSM